MSDNVLSWGWMIPLNRKLSSVEREELNEELYDNGDGIRINYEGTIAYIDNGENNGYGIFFNDPKTLDTSDFDILRTYDLSVDFEKAKFYVCHWYNGADSDMDMTTLEEFLSQ